MTDTISSAPAAVAPRRIWLRVIAIGIALMIVAMIVATLVVVDKPRFGFLVNEWFMPVMTSGVIVGGVLVFIAALMLPEKKSWRVITLIVWGLIAATSPLFGIMFLLPWSVLVLMLPV